MLFSILTVLIELVGIVFFLALAVGLATTIVLWIKFAIREIKKINRGN